MLPNEIDLEYIESVSPNGIETSPNGAVIKITTFAGSVYYFETTVDGLGEIGRALMDGAHALQRRPATVSN